MKIAWRHCRLKQPVRSCAETVGKLIVLFIVSARIRSPNYPVSATRMRVVPENRIFPNNRNEGPHTELPAECEDISE